MEQQGQQGENQQENQVLSLHGAQASSHCERSMSLPRVVKGQSEEAMKELVHLSPPRYLDLVMQPIHRHKDPSDIVIELI